MKLNHPYLFKVYGHFTENQNKYVITDFYNENLKTKYLVKKGDNEKYKEELIIDLMIQCLEGLDYLHKHNLIHRDIKPENIYISKDGKIKIGNFTYACRIKDENNQLIIKDPEGSKGYMAPEIYFGEEYNELCDVYSLGVTFAEICYGLNIDNYNNIYGEFIYDYYISEVGKAFQGFHGKLYSRKLNELLWDMLSFRPKNRPSVEICLLKLKTLD